MALSQKALQKKRQKHNQSRKGKKYNPLKYYKVVKGVAVEQAEPVYNSAADTITL